MRCLYCGKRLALLKKLTHGDFCCAAHRKLYETEEQQAALARLMAEPKRVDRSRSESPPRPQAAPQKLSPHELPGFCSYAPAERIAVPLPVAYVEPIARPVPACVIPEETDARTIPIGLVAERVATAPAATAPAATAPAATAPAATAPAATEAAATEAQVEADAPAATATEAGGSPPVAGHVLVLRAAPGHARFLSREDPLDAVAEPFWERLKWGGAPVGSPRLHNTGLVSLAKSVAGADRGLLAAALRQTVQPSRPEPALPGARLGLWTPMEAGEPRHAREALESTGVGPLVALAPPLTRAGVAAAKIGLACEPFDVPPRIPHPSTGDGPQTALPPLAARELRGLEPRGLFQLAIRVAEPDAGCLRFAVREELAQEGLAAAGLGALEEAWEITPPPRLAKQSPLALQTRLRLPDPERLMEVARPAAGAPVPSCAGDGARFARSLPKPPEAPALGFRTLVHGLPRRRTLVPLQIDAGRSSTPQARAVEAHLPAGTECVAPRCPFAVQSGPGWPSDSNKPLRHALRAASRPLLPQSEAGWLRRQPPEAVVCSSGLRQDESAFLALAGGRQSIRLLAISVGTVGESPRPLVDLAPLRCELHPLTGGFGSGAVPDFGPRLGGRLLPIELSALRSARGRGFAAPLPAHPEPDPAVPRLRLRPTELRIREATPKMPAAPPPTQDQRWKDLSRFWKLAPADLRWLAMVLPLVVVLAFWGSGRKPIRVVKEGEPRSEGLASFFDARWEEVRENIMHRAAVNLQDDFRSGLGDWEGGPNWGQQWQYDPAGFILPGPLAVFTPSRRLSDYSFEFLGQIEKKSLNWVVRAADLQNYYAMKIVLTNSGPMPEANLVRYPVIRGKAGKAVQTRIPLTVSRDMLYRARTDVRGSDFIVIIQGQMVASWTEERLGSGGVGLFSEKGERARLRWVQVSHQYDTLGRLCALLAPYRVPAADTGWSGK